MTADPPSFVADVAAQVVAWHNRHPLARRISRKDVQGIGIVSLPFAREGKRRWDAPQEKRGLLALMFPPRRNKRLWPVFSEDLVPEIGTQRLVKFARRHGQDQRPGPPGLPERIASFDRDLLEPDARQGGKGSRDRADQDSALPAERLDRYLVTAAIDIGPKRPRLMLGPGRRPAVLGQRLWSLPRLAALGAGLLLAMVISVAALWLKAMPQRGAASAVKPAASAVAQKPAASSAAHSPGQAHAPAPVASVAGPMQAPTATSVSPGASGSHAPVAAAAAPPTAPASVPSGHGIAPAASPGASALAHGPSSASAAPGAPVPAAPSLAAAGSAPAAAPAPVAPTPPSTLVQRASEPLVPRLRPDLAASARAESPARSPAGPSTAPLGRNPVAAGVPTPTPGSMQEASRPRAAAPASAQNFYALVTRPVRSKAEAEAMLKRLRAETDRIAHPTATQTALQESRDGWRATWWPFTNPRQAENARQALARRIELEVVDF